MFINITHSETGNNKGSSSKLVHYLEKENRVSKNISEKEEWFNGLRMDIRPLEVRVKIDNNVAKLGREDSKFFLVNISPSENEIRFLKNQYGESGVKQKLKQYTIKVLDEYALNFKRPGIESNNDLVWFGKLENHRYYSHADDEVKQKIRKQGGLKEGEQMHVQIIVSRKDSSNSIKLSPLNNSRGKNEEHSKKVGQFDRTAFKHTSEEVFDLQFGYERDLKETFRYANTQKNEALKQKVEMFLGQKNNERLKQLNIQKNSIRVSHKDALTRRHKEDDLVKHKRLRLDLK